MAANPNVYTYSRIACEALAELRSNMRLLAQYHIALESSDNLVSEPLFTYKAIQSYISQESFTGPHGPEKETFERLVKELQVASLSLSRVRTKADLIRWQSEGRFTVDDLFISNGFLDWIVGYSVKNTLSPAEMSRLGPFHDRAFPYPGNQVVVTFAVRYLKTDIYPEDSVEYPILLGIFD